MFRAHATTQAHPASQLHFEVHRTALAEAGADAAWAAAWLLFWLVFLLALAPPTTAFGEPIDEIEIRAGSSAQPIPAGSARGVAPADPGGAG